jgi:cytochrome P450
VSGRGAGPAFAVTRLELLRFLLERRKDPLGALYRIHQAHPGIARLDSGGGTFFLLVEPAHLRHVLVDNARNYTKESLYKRFEPLAGRGLFTNDGPSWVRQRKLVQPSFQRDRLPQFSAMMLANAQALAGRWAERAARAGTAGEPVDVAQEMIDLALDIVVETLLGSESGPYRETLRTSFGTMIAGIEARSFSDRIVELVPFARRSARLKATVQTLPIGPNRIFDEALAKLDEVVFRLIADKRRALAAGDESKRDVVSLLLRARDENGVGMTDKQLRDEVVTVLLAGHETTASALSWTFLMLSRHPGIERRVVAEMNDALGDRDATQEGVMKLAYTVCVFDEVLRLYPPFWRLTRTAAADDVIDGCAIPAGATLILVPYFTHRLERIWPNPEGFDPERFLPEAVASRERASYISFGAGPRSCIGESFAMLEVLIILSTVLRRMTLSLVPGQTVAFDPRLSLRSKFPLWMRPALRTRDGATAA